MVEWLEEAGKGARSSGEGVLLVAIDGQVTGDCTKRGNIKWDPKIWSNGSMRFMGRCEKIDLTGAGNSNMEAGSICKGSNGPAGTSKGTMTGVCPG